MMILPNPGVLDNLVRDRQQGLQRAGRPRPARAASGLRVRVGHALITAGSALSGERVERSASPHTLAHVRH